MVAFLKAAGVAAALMVIGGAASAQVSQGRVEAGGVVFDALSPQPLSPGQCGMFLWSRGEQPVFFLFVADDPRPGSVKARLNGRDELFPRVQFGGERASGHFSYQKFKDSGVQIEVDVRFDPERPLQQGMMLKDGVVRVEDRKGWRTVVPVLGLIGCQN